MNFYFYVNILLSMIQELHRPSVAVIRPNTHATASLFASNKNFKQATGNVLLDNSIYPNPSNTGQFIVKGGVPSFSPLMRFNGFKAKLKK